MVGGQDVVTEQACPVWCELPAGHDADSKLRAHRAAVFDLDDRAHVSVVEVVVVRGQDHGVYGLLPTMIDVEFRVDGSFDEAETWQIHDALQAAYRRRDEIAATNRRQG
jgi:hypothetical protein